MALVQAQFEYFHQIIKCSPESNSIFRDSKNFLFDLLKKNFPENAPAWHLINTGLYTMDVGVKPVKNSFKFEVGISFEASPTEFPDPLELVMVVRDALGDNCKVEIHDLCLNAQFGIEDKIVNFEISLYANEYQRIYMAYGSETGIKEDRSWCITKPAKLVNYINSCHHYDSAQQLRRIIRYLLRWRDKKFKRSILSNTALIVIATEVFESNFNSENNSPRDIYALFHFVQSLQRRFQFEITINSPIPPYQNLTKSVTGEDLANLKKKLHNLEAALIDAIHESNIEKACLILRGQFGKDFPVPDRSGNPDFINSISISMENENSWH